MRELLRTKGLKMTHQRELILSSFFELGKHVSVDELYRKVATIDSSIGYSTVWRNLKLMARVGLAEEVNIGDGVTRYDHVTEVPHGHLYCRVCKQFIEFDINRIVKTLTSKANDRGFTPEGFKIEVQGICSKCSSDKKTGKQSKKTKSKRIKTTQKNRQR